MFKIDKLGRNKWAKFVPMQQHSAALIHDLNTMKGTTESYRTAIQNGTVSSIKRSHLRPKSLKKKKNEKLL